MILAGQKTKQPLTNTTVGDCEKYDTHLNNGKLKYAGSFLLMIIECSTRRLENIERELFS